MFSLNLKDKKTLKIMIIIFLKNEPNKVKNVLFFF